MRLVLDVCFSEEPICGNGILQLNEICDDGNTDDDDWCSSDCRVETQPPSRGVVSYTFGGESVLHSGESPAVKAMYSPSSGLVITFLDAGVSFGTYDFEEKVLN